MLVSFSLENWMSYSKKTEFSMIATRERSHGQRVPLVEKYQNRIVPIAAIYGGNASGKTNFFKAISFAKFFIVRGTQPDALIPIEPFRLNDSLQQQPCSFTFTLLIDEIMYEFSFRLSRKSVLEEKLVRITSTSETVLYHRKNGKAQFTPALAKDQFLNFAFQGTRDNQLFLTNAISQKVDTFKPVYDWFKDSLELIAPDTRFEPFEEFLDEANPLYSTMNDMLTKLDTGIQHLGSEELSFDNLPLPEALKVKLQEEVKEGMAVRLRAEPMNERYIVTRKNGELLARKLVAFHPKQDGTEAKFDIKLESDGSQRVIDLLPAFLDIVSNVKTKVYIIDEVDRSLHTLLTRNLIESYLASCTTKSRSQLLFTTHDVLLMDQELLRRDEMWVAERDNEGNSSLIAFSDYKDVRSDKDIRKSYLQGRLGGIPRLMLAGSSTKGITSAVED